ncbi:unnamed protein product, partial [Laminaria digitata]
PPTPTHHRWHPQDTRSTEIQLPLRDERWGGLYVGYVTSRRPRPPLATCSTEERARCETDGGCHKEEEGKNDGFLGRRSSTSAVEHQLRGRRRTGSRRRGRIMWRGRRRREGWGEGRFLSRGV